MNIDRNLLMRRNIVKQTRRSVTAGSAQARAFRRTVPIARLRNVLPTVLFACGLATQTASATAAQPTTELDTEAAFLTKLAPFVDWPVNSFSSPESPLVVCVMSADPLTTRVEKVAASQKDGKRRIRLRVVSSSDVVDDCHILYLGTAGDSAAQIARTVRHRPVLTVCRSRADADADAMIVFVVDRGRVRFDIDAAGATDSRLAIRPELLALARNVNPSFPPR